MDDIALHRDLRSAQVIFSLPSFLFSFSTGNNHFADIHIIYFILLRSKVTFHSYRIIHCLEFEWVAA